MKKIIRIVLLTIAIFGTGLLAEDKASAAVKIDATNFPDEYVRETVMEKDSNKDGILSDNELNEVKKIDFNLGYDCEVDTFKGMEHFTSLSSICLDRIKAAENLLQYFPKVTHIYSTSSNISIKGNASNLEYLSSGLGDSFSVLDIQAPKLKTISFENNNIPNGYRIYAPNLELIYIIGKANISGIQTSGTKVKKIVLTTDVYNNQAGYTSLNFSKYKNLEELDCSNNKKLTSINISGLKKLKILKADNCKLKSLSIKTNAKLEVLRVRINKLKSINVSKNKALKSMSVSDNDIKKLDVSKNKKLEYLEVNGLLLKKLDLSSNTKLYGLGALGTFFGTLKLPVVKKGLYILNDDQSESASSPKSVIEDGEVKTLDLSKFKSLKNLKSKRSEKVHLKKDFFKKIFGLKTVIINKKLKKSDKKYIKKLAKKCKAKVVTKK